MTDFKKGDQVKFTTKFGDELIGTFEEYDTVPYGTGEKEVYIVMAKPFESMGDIRCIVPIGHLERAGQ